MNIACNVIEVIAAPLSMPSGTSDTVTRRAFLWLPTRPQNASDDAMFLLLMKISYFDWTETFGECKVS